jgi:hypothetical protein
MSTRDASEIIHKNNYKTRFINYYTKKKNTVNAIVNINGGSGAANEASEVIYLSIGCTQVTDADLGILGNSGNISVSTVSIVYVSTPAPLGTVVTPGGIFIIDGTPTLHGIPSGDVIFPGPITSIATDSSGGVYVSTSNAVYLNGPSGPVSMNITGLSNVSAMVVGPGPGPPFYFIQGSQIYTAAGSNSDANVMVGSSGEGFEDGPGSSAKLNTPGGFALDSSGAYLWVADTGNSLIRKIETLPPYMVNTEAGNKTGFINPFPTDNVGNRDGKGLHGESLVYRPKGITISPSGIVYIADTNNNNVRSLFNGNLATIAGKTGFDPVYDISPPGFVIGPSTDALFDGPTAIFYYNSALYITEPPNNSVRLITLV